MSGYTVKFSVSLIETFLDNGFFEDVNHIGERNQALSELKVHFEHGNVSKNLYEILKRRLTEISYEEC